MKFHKILFFVFIFFIPAVIFSQNIQNAGDELLKGLEGKKQRIAVLDFELEKESLKPVSVVLRERLTTYLVQSGKVDVIERALLTRILKEHNLNVSGVIDPETGEKLGKVLGVQAVITGTVYGAGGKKAEFNGRMIRVDTGKILSASNLILSLNRDETEIVALQSKNQEYSGEPLIQLAILLDTSNSMDGLINQTKTQLWKIVNKMAEAEREGKNPDIEIALYEYGNDNIEKSDNYIRQVSAFTKNLDLISQELFALKTRGGSEYTGAAIQDSVNKLKWKKQKGVYKAIFIAGNESFQQGPVSYEEAISDAKENNIFVNTIFCGTKQQGIAMNWEDAAKIGRGLFMNIDQEQQVAAIRAPQDDEITRLGREINKTYIPYGGKEEKEKAVAQSQADEMAASAPASSGAEVNRMLFKSKKQYASSMNWDVVTLVEQGKIKPEDINKENLPDQYKNKSSKEIETAINQEIKRRKDIRNKIEELAQKRKLYIAEEEKKRAEKTKSNSLDKAMEGAVEVQASGLDYKFGK